MGTDRQYALTGQSVGVFWLYLMAALGIAAGLAILVLMRKERIKSRRIYILSMICCVLFALLGFTGVRQLDSLRKQYEDVIEMKANNLMQEMLFCLNSLQSFDADEPITSALYVIETAGTLQNDWDMLVYELRDNGSLDSSPDCARTLSVAFKHLCIESRREVLSGCENTQELEEYYCGAAQKLSELFEFMSSRTAYKQGYIGYYEWTFTSFNELCADMLFFDLSYDFREACIR